MIIKITHQEDKSIHEFEVANEDSLTNKEVVKVCNSMNVTAILINGKYYEV
jgi:cytochrome b involved in lipid metabolism